MEDQKLTLDQIMEHNPADIVVNPSIFPYFKALNIDYDVWYEIFQPHNSKSVRNLSLEDTATIQKKIAQFVYEKYCEVC